MNTVLKVVLKHTEHKVLCQAQEGCSSTLFRMLTWLCHHFPEPWISCPSNRFPISLSSHALTATIGVPVSMNLNLYVACINGTSQFSAVMTGLLSSVSSGLLCIVTCVRVPFPLEAQWHCSACVTQAVPAHRLLWMLLLCAWVCRCLFEMLISVILNI